VNPVRFGRKQPQQISSGSWSSLFYNHCRGFMTHHINYQVLARTTRPTKFSELIGQEALTQTLKNAIESGRLAHAFVLTGIRGVGKTTIARLIARALNCVGVDGTGQPTSEPCGVCDQCQMIAEDRHVDVIEVDAATRTGVDDMRQLMEGISYKPVMGRYKIYIIDEVHMLSKNAFNSLLKTLEEPPPHVKFIFATTEIRKVPLTILSRCQRFDLRRIPVDVLLTHFQNILQKEGVQFEMEALECIARAAGGSVRDGLSILEQAIVKVTDNKITVSTVQEMLGLADREKIATVFNCLMRGLVRECLEATKTLYEEGADPDIILQDLLGTTYQTLSFKVSGAVSAEGNKLQALAEKIEPKSLMLVWQVLMKGAEEMKASTMPLENLEVILIRAMHIQGMVGKENRGEIPSLVSSSLSPVSAVSSPVVSPERLVTSFRSDGMPKTFEDVIQLFEKKREPIIVDYLTNDVGLVDFRPGAIKLNQLRESTPNLQPKVAKFLSECTGASWLVELVTEKGQESLGVQRALAREKREKDALSTEEAKKISELFPGAQVVVK